MALQVFYVQLIRLSETLCDGERVSALFCFFFSFETKRWRFQLFATVVCTLIFTRSLCVEGLVPRAQHCRGVVKSLVGNSYLGGGR